MSIDMLEYDEISEQYNDNDIYTLDLFYRVSTTFPFLL